ncbi:lipid A 3-O-deacylase PagL [Lutibacter oceani]|uniref:Lipid A 3-O-deacylase PagL n=1 Tax=Lutibacter oceani TaxID=1853311 RepID=A0A3D9RTI8_9FLAO|nr:acyloxyacyl hydrolase [Lutibacter oceani]REE83177.1 lipid A 3-O-deacylase PagL [Lutibacter oceani]
MKNLIIVFFLLFTLQGVSQNETFKYNNIQTDFFFGKPIEHDKKLKDAIEGNSFGVLLSFNTTNTKNTHFNKLYNYPERGYSFLYQNFNSSVLGEVFGGYRHYSYNLKNTSNNQLKLISGFGLGYATKTYDAETNPKNQAIGSKLLASAFLKLQFFQLLKKEKLSVNTGVSLIHFSNIALKNPNLGINTVNLNLGINYLLEPIKIATSKDENTISEIDKKLYFNLILRAGYNESLEINSGLFPFYTLTFYGSKTLNKFSNLTFGTDYFKSEFLKNHIKNINTEEGKTYNENDYSRAGIFVGHELMQNNFSFISQIGYTIYYPFPYVSRVYERFGLKYKLSKHLFSEITMKINLFRAEALEFGIGYKF